jgi:hypothetical protein
MEIVATAADVKDPTKQMVQAQAGDDEPEKTKWSSEMMMISRKITWLVMHYGIKYGHYPLLQIKIPGQDQEVDSVGACCTLIYASQAAS